MIGLASMTGCDPVEPSPDPGVLRVTLQADPADSTINIAREPFNVNALPARMLVSVSKGRVYRDTSYANLFQDSRDFSIGLPQVNVLRRFKGKPPDYPLYETLLPPATYDSLVIVVGAERFVIGTQNNDVSVPGGGETLTFREPFQISEGDTTTVHLRIKPLVSLTRFKDRFIFSPDVQVQRID